MTIDSDIFNALALNTGVSSMVGARIYPNVAPEEVAKPYIIITRILTNHQNSLDGTNALRNPHFQIDMFGTRRDDLRILADAVQASMMAASFPAVPGNDLETYEPDTRIHHIIQDYSVWTVG